MLVITLLRIVETLQRLGFNTGLLSSTDHVLDRVKSLKEEDVGKTVVFVKNSHPRFFRFFSLGLPFGHMEDYEGKVNAATLEQLAGLIKTCGFLMQTKAYLFWTFYPLNPSATCAQDLL